MVENIINLTTTVRPWDARFLGNGKSRVAQNSCNLSYLIRQRQDHPKKKRAAWGFHYINWCISTFFGPYSKTCIVKVRADWGRVSRGLTVAWNAVDLTFAMVTSKTHHFPRQTASIEYAWNLKNSSNDRSIISRFFKTLGLDWWSWDHLSSFSFDI